MKEERDKLKRMIKERVKGNELDIVYKLGKNCKHEFFTSQSHDFKQNSERNYK